MGKKAKIVDKDPIEKTKVEMPALKAAKDKKQTSEEDQQKSKVEMPVLKKAKVKKQEPKPDEGKEELPVLKPTLKINKQDPWHEPEMPEQQELPLEEMLEVFKPKEEKPKKKKKKAPKPDVQEET